MTLWVDATQSSANGLVLAFARFAVVPTRRYDFALLRVASVSLRAVEPCWISVPEGLATHQLQAFPARYVVTGIFERDPAKWSIQGVDVVEYRRNVPLYLADGSANPRVARVTRELLNHPVWESTRQAHALAAHLPRAPQPRSGPRL